MLNEPFTRLLQEQEKATAQTESRISQLASFQSEYECLISRLEELQKSVSQPALIPFGRKALVYGRLIHTNEILAHLGGGGAGEHDYFAQLSTCDAVKLINRRIENIANQINWLQQQKKLIDDRILYTSELANKPLRIVNNSKVQDVSFKPGDHSSGEEEVEIREDYDYDTEVKWQEQHRMRYRQERGLEPPTKLSGKRVSFDLSNLHDRPSPSHKSGDSSDQSDDVDCRATIYFSHSKSPATVPSISHSNDSCKLTPSEAVDMVIKHRFIQLSEEHNHVTPLTSQLNRLHSDSTEYPSIPFSDVICERKCEISLQTVPSDNSPANISKFRTSRLKSKHN